MIKTGDLKSRKFVNSHLQLDIFEFGRLSHFISSVTLCHLCTSLRKKGWKTRFEVLTLPQYAIPFSMQSPLVHSFDLHPTPHIWRPKIPDNLVSINQNDSLNYGYPAWYEYSWHYTRKVSSGIYIYYYKDYHNPPYHSTHDLEFFSQC